jgi:NAD(P)-dependent dehydrogenase (short-subunit alcohol dehydrogenase family)
MELGLAGRRAIVTGGSKGLGRAIAAELLAEGAQVVICSRHEAELEATAAELRGAGRGPSGDDPPSKSSCGASPARIGGTVVALRCDVTDPDQVTEFMAAAASALGGGIDVLVNNAGVGVQAGLLNTPVQAFDMVMGVNLRGCFLYARAAYPHLAARRGSMIHIGSDAGVWGERSIGAYSVSKAAVIMLGKMLALEGGPDGVRSNVLCPGDTWPGMRHMGPPGQAERGEDDGDWPVPPIGRIGRAGDVAAAAVFYASADADFLTGTTLLVDGGMTAGYHQREHG